MALMKRRNILTQYKVNITKHKVIAHNLIVSYSDIKWDERVNSC